MLTMLTMPLSVLPCIFAILTTGTLDLSARGMSAADGALLGSALRDSPLLRPTAIDLSGNPLGANAVAVVQAPS